MKVQKTSEFTHNYHLILGTTHTVSKNRTMKW